MKRICSPSAWASDRIFFSCQTENKYTIDMYYMMLDEKNPKLVYGGQISDKILVEQYEEENKDNGTEEKTNLEEITIFDNEDGVLKITGARQKGSSYIIDVFFEVGESGRDYDVKIEALINGIQCHSNKSFDTIYPQEGNSTIEFSKETLEEYGVTDVYSLEEFTDIELIFYVNETEDFVKGEEILKKSVHIYPKGEDAVVHYTREAQETDIVVVDNEKVKVTLIGYEKTKVENDTPVFLVENKTDKEIQFNVQAGSINGYQDNAIYDFAREEIQAGACAFRKIIFGPEGLNIAAVKNFWEEYDITEVGKIKMLIDVGYVDVAKIKMIGEPFVEEIVTLYPQGEEHARDDARKPQATDVVLVENEYIKITLIGYQDYEYYNYTNNELNANVIPSGYAKIVVQNKTEDVLYSQIPVDGDDGIVYSGISFKDPLLPGENYLHVVGSVTTGMYPEGQEPIISKIEFLYQVLDKEKNTVCQEYISVYPQGEENVKLCKVDIESMEEVLVNNEKFTIAVNKYTNGRLFDEENPYPNCTINFAFLNKTEQMICLEMENIFVNGVEHIVEVDDWSVERYIVFPQESSLIGLNVYQTVEDANMTELEEVEMTFKVYSYNYQNDSVGEELGSQTVKFSPK